MYQVWGSNGGGKMTIDELMCELNMLKERVGGDADVTVWQYDGGLDTLCDVAPAFNDEFGVVIFEVAQRVPKVQQ
jgi:hypothetical protein